MELDQLEVGLADACGAVGLDFDGGAQVQELGFIDWGNGEFGFD